MDLDQNQIMCMPSTSASVQTTMQTEQLIYGKYALIIISQLLIKTLFIFIRNT